MRALRRDIRGCPEPLEFVGAGHFVQEWGEEDVAAAAIAALQHSCSVGPSPASSAIEAGKWRARLLFFPIERIGGDCDDWDRS